MRLGGHAAAVVPGPALGASSEGHSPPGALGGGNAEGKEGEAGMRGGVFLLWTVGHHWGAGLWRPGRTAGHHRQGGPEAGPRELQAPRRVPARVPAARPACSCVPASRPSTHTWGRE